MTAGADPQQIHHWQNAVARDPGDPAFLPLAEVYRREGRLEVARRLCVRGLARHPEMVEAHVLLGRILRELNEPEPALDEFDIALRLDPTHRTARRALGYLCLERRDWAGAVHHLELAAAADRNDERVASALALARRRSAAAQEETAPAEDADLARVLAGPLDRFVRESGARFTLLVDADGRILAEHGFARDLDLAGFASLSAGVNAASRELAKMLGQPRFRQLSQGTGDHQLFIGTVAAPAGELLLCAAFGTDTTLGLVRVCFDRFAREAALAGEPSSGPARVDAAGFEAGLADGLHRARAAAPELHS